MLKIYLARLGSDFSANKSIDIKDCVNAMDHENNTPLALAASKGDLTTVRTLLEYQANPNNATSDKSPLFEAIKSKQLDVVDALLCAGANTDAQDSDTSSSALHHAVRSEKIAMVRLLLKHNASPSLTDKMRQTPLHWAIQLSKNQTNRSMRIERLLLQSGADINAKDIFGKPRWMVPVVLLLIALRFYRPNSFTYCLHWFTYRTLDANYQSDVQKGEGPNGGTKIG